MSARLLDQSRAWRQARLGSARSGQLFEIRGIGDQANGLDDPAMRTRATAPQRAAMEGVSLSQNMMARKWEAGPVFASYSVGQIF